MSRYVIANGKGGERTPFDDAFGWRLTISLAADAFVLHAKGMARPGALMNLVGCISCGATKNTVLSSMTKAKESPLK